MGKKKKRVGLFDNSIFLFLGIKMNKYCALILFCLISVVLSQQHRCVAPSFFEAHLQMYDHRTGFFRDGRFSYDSVEQKVRIVEEVSENATQPQYDELMLFGMKKRFSLDLKTKKCEVSDLTEPFRHIEAGIESHYMGESTIGLPSPRAVGMGVVLSSWSATVNRGHIKGHEFYSFTRDDCIPVSETFYGIENASKGKVQQIHFHRNYYDVTIGLHDPQVFDIPTECMKQFNLVNKKLIVTL